jgi:predicted outer membrane lipoprotein
MSGSRRLVLSGIALTALLALVALASHAHRPGGGQGGGTSETPKLIFEYGASVMFILLPFGIITVLWVASLGRRQKLLDGGGSFRSELRTIFSFALVAIPVAYLIRHFVTSQVNPRPGGIGAGGGATGSAQVSTNHAATGQFHWVVALIVGSLLLAVAVGVVAAIVVKRMRGDDWEREATLSAALDEVLADTLDDLRAEKSPRRAVIRAFARMEKTFAAHSVEREPSETPREYVERALDRLGVSSASVRQLTNLYERAKFSRLEIDEAMKADAIDALAGLRAELVEPDARAAA